MSKADRIFVLQNRKRKTSHILHLILTLLTGGFWVFMWAGLALNNSNHNRDIDRQINTELEKQDD